MPFTLTLTHHGPALVVHARRSRRRAGVEGVQTLWLGLFQDARRCLRRAPLTESLQASHLLDTRSLLDRTWLQCADAPGRPLLQVLATALVEAAAETREAAVSGMVGQSVSFVSGLPETEQEVAGYVGEQFRLIGTTTLHTVHRVAYTGWQDNTAASVLARELEAVFGLTPTQQRGRDALRQRLLDAGQGTRVVRQTLTLATQQALQQRARLIAETQAWTLSQMGERILWDQAVRQGVIAATEVRRFWQLAANPCLRCAAIPPLNPEGVRIMEPFASTEGPVMDPGIHPNCKCYISYRILP